MTKGKCKRCNESLGTAIMGITFNRKRYRCFECLQYICVDCFWSSTKRCKICNDISLTRFNYSAISALPTKTLKAYVQDVVGMTEIDVERSLTEKTDFVDKILQFKGIDAQKQEYLAGIHHTNTNSRPDSRVHLNESTSTSANLHQQDSFSPVIRENSISSSNNQPMDATGRIPNHHRNEDQSSPRSSISTLSDGFPMLEDDIIPPTTDQMSIDSEIIVPERERAVHSSNHTPQHQSQQHTIANEAQDNYEIQRLQRYTVKELKNFLAAANVNYQGILEKHELLAKAVRLVKNKQNDDKIFNEQTGQQQQSQSQSATQQETGGSPGQDEKDVCKVCWDATIDCVLLECGHMCTCTVCAKKLKECPICREHVVRCVHVFRV